LVNRISENDQDILERAKSTAKSMQSAHLAGLGVGRIGPFGSSTAEIQDLMPERPLCGPAVRRSGLHRPDNTDLKILVPKRGIDGPALRPPQARQYRFENFGAEERN